MRAKDLITFALSSYLAVAPVHANKARIKEIFSRMHANLESHHMRPIEPVNLEREQLIQKMMRPTT